MNSLVVLCLLSAVLFVILLLRIFGRIRKGKVMRAGIYALPAVVTLSTVILLLLIISNLTSYQRLTHERNILRLTVQAESAGNYQVILEFLDKPGEKRVEDYLLEGDEWQLEAKILKWKGWANLVGLDSYYRLDRISGRYRDIDEATRKPPSAFHLSGEERGINLWALKRVMKTNLPILDAYFGQSVFLPLEQGAIYVISVNQSGLLARPQNSIGQQAVESW